MDATPKPIEHSKAWGLLLANLLVVPGIGSILGGRKIGWLQLLLSVLGLVMTLIWLLTWGQELMELERLPPNGGSRLFMGIGGVVVFGIAWVGSLLTGLSMLRHSQPPNVPPVLTPPPTQPPV